MRKLLRLGKHEILSFLLAYLLGFCATPTSQTTNCEPVNIGLIAALPWDIANTLRTPLGGPVSLVLSCVMALILVFGFVLSPVNYILGYPSRIYHPARQPGLISNLYPLPPLKIKKEKDGRSLEFGESYSEYELDFPANSTLEDEFNMENQLDPLATHPYPDFESSAFFFIPETDKTCQKLIVCHAHGFLQIFPERLTKVLRYFSKRITFIPNEYKDAVIVGLKSQAECQKLFRCGKEISVILKDVLYNLMSVDMKNFWKLRKLFKSSFP